MSEIESPLDRKSTKSADAACAQEFRRAGARAVRRTRHRRPGRRPSAKSPPLPELRNRRTGDSAESSKKSSASLDQDIRAGDLILRRFDCLCHPVGPTVSVASAFRYVFVDDDGVIFEAGAPGSWSDARGR